MSSTSDEIYRAAEERGDFWTLIRLDQITLRNAVKELAVRGQAYARADVEYRKIKSIAILEERAKGTAWGACKDIIYEREDVSDALFRRDCAEAERDACIEGINALKLQIRVNESQYAREWGHAGKEGNML